MTKTKTKTKRKVAITIRATPAYYKQTKRQNTKDKDKDINLKLPFDSPEFGCIFSTISSLSLFTFHFSTHSGEEPIFGSLPL